MFSEQQFKTLNEAVEYINFIQEFYLKIHSKITAFVEKINSNSMQFKNINDKSDNVSDSNIRSPVSIFYKIWQLEGKRVTYPKKQHVIFQQMKGRLNHFSGQFNNIKKTFKFYQKQATKLDHDITDLNKLVRQCYDPSIYYNNQQYEKTKQTLVQKLDSYIKLKQMFISQKEVRQNTVKQMNKLYEWMNKQIETFLQQSAKHFDKLENDIISMIKQIFKYLIDETNNQVQKLQIPESSNRLTHKKCQNINSPEISDKKYFQQSRIILKQKQQSLKSDELFFHKIRISIFKLQQIKQSFQKQLIKLTKLKQKISPMYSHTNCIGSLKLFLNSILNIYDCEIFSLKQILESSIPCQKLSIIKSTTLQNLKQILNKDGIELQNIEQTKESCEIQFNIINEVQLSGDKIISKAILNSLTKFNSSIKQVLETSLSNKQNQIKTFKLQVFKLQNLELKINLNPDQTIRKQIQQQLEKQKLIIQVDVQKPEKSYSCMLEVLAGKLKVYPDAIGYESLFNQKNLLFGTTELIIPKSEIIEIKKETLLLIPSAIKVETKRGVLLFTALLNRDKSFDRIDNMLNNQQEKIINAQQSQIEVKTYKNDQIVIQQVELQKIKIKSLTYQIQLLQEKPMAIFELKINGLNIRQVFRQFFNETKIFSYKRKTYKNLKQCILSNNSNTQIVFGRLSPQPPKYYQPNSLTNISQVMKSQRTLNYKHQVDTIPIPFLPKYGLCSQKQIFYWISDKMFIIESQTLTSGIPYSDSIIVRNKTIVQQTNQGVKINESAETIFKKSLSFEKIIHSSMQKQLKKTGDLMKQLIQKSSKQVLQIKINNNNNKTKQNSLVQIQQKQEQQRVQQQQIIKQMQEEFNNKIVATNAHNRKQQIVGALVFLFVLILSRFI